MNEYHLRGGGAGDGGGGGWCVVFCCTGLRSHNILY